MPHIDEWIWKFERTYRYSDAKAFLSKILDDHARTRIEHFLGAGVSNIVFRGISDHKHTNIPRVFRRLPRTEESVLSDFQFEHLEHAKPSTDQRALALFIIRHRLCELRAVFNFLDFADRLGISTPYDYYNLNNEFQIQFQRMKEIYEKVDTEASLAVDLLKDLTPFPTGSLREAFAMAQHYGVPTRLLDFTEAPLVAMFFAVSNVWQSILSGKPKRKRRSICVYAIGDGFARQVGLELVQISRQRNPRLRAQHGVFLVDPHAERYFMENGNWASIEDHVSRFQNTYKGSLSGGTHTRSVKYILKASEEWKLARLLSDFGITFETMHPSLEAAANGWTYRKTIMKAT